MAIEITTADSIKAARLVRNCPMEKVPLVVEILRQGGFDITDGAFEKAKQIAGEIETAKLQVKRSVADKSKWKETDNEFVLMLREAYDEGISFPAICAKTGLNKSTIYRYLYGEKIGTKRVHELIMNAIEDIREENEI